MSLSPEDDISEPSNVPTPKINLDDEFIISQQEKMNVYLRLRPLLPAEILQDSQPCIYIQDAHGVRAVAPHESAKYKSSAHDNSGLEQIFRFTRTFGPHVDQVQFFEETMKTTLENFIRGQNELVFAYGSTGSGKTYTMQGGLAQPGVIPLTIHLLFCSIKGRQVTSPDFKPHKYSDVVKLSKLEQDLEEATREKLLSHIDSEGSDDNRSLSGKSSVSLSTVFSDDSLDTSSHANLTDKEVSILESTLRLKNIANESVNMQGDVLFSIWVSFVEIYNENIYDLLVPFTSNKRPRLSLKEDENRNIYVKGLKEIRVASSEEALKLFSLGKRNLRIASTKLNYQSSRSHCIFSIKIVRVLGIDSPLSARVNRLSYCDLAGSERTAKTQNTGVRLKEAGNINTSLLVLGRCIEALRQQGPKDKKVVPYRDSKLTRLFSAFFMGKGKASLIINVSPASHIFDETLNVLKFSALAKQVISNDLSTRPLSHWNQEINRLTEAWEKSSTRWSSFCRSSIPNKDSVDEIAETSLEDESDFDNSFEEINQRDQIIETLFEHLRKLSAELKKVTIEKANLETEIRAQVLREFSENFVQIDNCYRERLKDLEECSLVVGVGPCKKRKNELSKDADEEENAEDTEVSDDEKDYSSAHEDTPPPVLSKAIEDSETEMLEDKNVKKSEPKSGRSANIDGKTKSSPRKTKERRQNNSLKDNEAKKYEILLSSKDEEIEELQKRIDQQNAAFVSSEEKVQQLQNIIDSKDADFAALKAKMQEAETTCDKEFGEYEKILSSKGEEVLQIKEEIKEKDAKISLHEGKIKELEDVISKRHDEMTELKQQYESQISSKDYELKECLKSLNSRTHEITDLKGTLEDMQKTITSNERELKEYINVVNLKDLEITLLTGRDAGSRANGIKQHETALRSKDEEINELKKKLETEHFYFLEKDKELENLKNAMKSKDVELAKLKKKLEENVVVVPKEEMKESERKDMEISELKEATENLQKELASKKKEIEDYESIVCLKNTEVYLLKEKIEESEVIISKPKELFESDAIIKSKEESIARLKKEVEDHRKTLFFKDKELEECRNNLNSREKELSALRDKIEELEVNIPENSEVKEYKKSLNSKEAEIMKLKKKIEELQGLLTSKDGTIQQLEITIQEGGDILVTKDSEIDELQKQISDLKNKNKKSKYGKTKDDNNIIKSQEIEIESLNTRIVKLHQTISMKDKLLKELETKVKKAGDVSSKNTSVRKLRQRVSEFESNEAEDDHIEVHENEGKAEELCSDDKEIVPLQQKIAEFGRTVLDSKEFESKAPEWQNVQYLIQLLEESSKTFASQNAKIATMKKTYNELEEKFEGNKKLIQQEFNKKFEEQEDSLSKKNTEIQELEGKLAQEKLVQQDLSKKLGKLEEFLSDKDDEIKELQQKLTEDISKSEEKCALSEKQRKYLEDLVTLLQRNEHQAYSTISDLKQKLVNFKAELNKKNTEIQNLIIKAKEVEEKGKERQRLEEERERQRAEEEQTRQLAEQERERQRAEEETERLRVEEVRERCRTEEERERREAEERKKSLQVEKEMQTENYETEKCEKEVQTENFQCQNKVETIAQSIERSKKTITLKSGFEEIDETDSEENDETDGEENGETDGEENGDIDIEGDDTSASEAHEQGSVDIADANDSVDPKESAELQTRISFAEYLLNLLQKLECLATESIVRLQSENRSYCKTFLHLSENYDRMRLKLAAAEQGVTGKQRLERKIKSEDSSDVKPHKVSLAISKELEHLIDILQKIEQASTRNRNRLTDENFRLLNENSILLNQLQASKVELDIATEEIEGKAQECCKIQGRLRKKEACILCLEHELDEARKKISSLETKSKMQLLEEQTQHGIEVEQVIALKRQAETDYRCLERKLQAAVNQTETKESRQRKRQNRLPLCKGKKRTSTDEDKDFEPRQKRRMVKSKSKVYVQDDDSVSVNSLGSEKLDSTETPSSLQRLQEYVVAKSPVIKAVADRVATFLNTRSECSEDISTKVIKKKRKLFNNSSAPSLISSPVQEVVKKVSPKKTVNRRFRSKKDCK